MYKQINIIKINSIIKSHFCVGHLKKTLAFNNNALIYGFRHQISIYNYIIIWKSLLYFYKFFSYLIFKRNFIIFYSNNKLVNKYISKLNFLNKNHVFMLNNFNSFNGLLTNLNILYELHKKKKYKFLNNFKTLYLKRKIYPDIIFFFSKNYNLYVESSFLKIPTISLVDTDNNVFNFLYKIYSNDDSINVFFYLTKVIKKAFNNGIHLEQEFFFKILLSKLQKKYNNK